jgi:hypothetical protein
MHAQVMRMFPVDFVSRAPLYLPIIQMFLSNLPTSIHYAASRMQMSAFPPRPLSLVTIFPSEYSTCMTLGVSLTSTSTKPAGW